MPRHWRRLWHDLTALVDAMNRHDLGSYAAALAYNFLFALFPLLLVVSAGLAFVHLPLATVLNGPWQALVPAASWQLVLSNVQVALTHQNAGALGLGTLGFLWGMSGAFRQFMDAVNHAYGFPYPWRRHVVVFYLISLALSVTVGIGVTAGLVLSVLETRLLRDVVWHGAAVPPQLAVVDSLRWGVLLAAFWLMLAVLYWIAPDEPPPFRWITPGALLVLVGWLLLASGFSYYAGHLAHYNAVYGTLGRIILLLVYLYLFGLLLLLGAQVNAYADRRRAGDVGPDASRRNPGG
jgi:membrane protein